MLNTQEKEKGKKLRKNNIIYTHEGTGITNVEQEQIFVVVNGARSEFERSILFPIAMYVFIFYLFWIFSNTSLQRPHQLLHTNSNTTVLIRRMHIHIKHKTRSIDLTLQATRREVNAHNLIRLRSSTPHSTSLLRVAHTRNGRTIKRLRQSFTIFDNFTAAKEVKDLDLPLGAGRAYNNLLTTRKEIDGVTGDIGATELPLALARAKVPDLDRVLPPASDERGWVRELGTEDAVGVGGAGVAVLIAALGEGIEEFSSVWIVDADASIGADGGDAEAVGGEVGAVGLVVLFGGFPGAVEEDVLRLFSVVDVEAEEATSSGAGDEFVHVFFAKFTFGAEANTR